MNLDKHLDEQVRKALENLQAKLNGNAWEAFEQRLDEATSSDAPNEGPADSFDEVISGKLTQLEVPLALGDWSRMEKMIEANETAELLENEAVVDNIVSERLENLQVVYQPHHWQMMAQRLEEEFFFRYHLIRCKVAEASLMALLLLTIVHFTPVLNQGSEGSQHPKGLRPSTLIPGKEITPELPSGNTAKIPIAANLPKPTKQKRLTKTQVAQANQSPSVGQEIAENAFSQADKLAPSTLPSLPLSNLSRLGTAPSLYEEMTEKRFLQNKMVTPSQTSAELGSSGLLASLEPQPVQSAYAWELPQLPERIFQKEPKLRFSIFTTTDVAYVLTPPNTYSVFDTLVATGQDTTLASGYGGGITVSWKKGKWEFQTGGIYSFKRYIPNTPVFLFETVNYYIREEFNGVQLDMLEVPLNASYHLKNQGKWRVYGNVGASGHFVTSSVYEIKTDRTPSFSNFAMLPTPNHLPKDDKSIREEKEFPDGLFDGGSIHDNFYLTANVGLGVERFVSPRWCLFFQPNYQHHFLTDGIGANGEKLYNFSFYLGTKVSLK